MLNDISIFKNVLIHNVLNSLYLIPLERTVLFLYLQYSMNILARFEAATLQSSKSNLTDNFLFSLFFSLPQSENSSGTENFMLWAVWSGSPY